jgi:hypothetical protein
MELESAGGKDRPRERYETEPGVFRSMSCGTRIDSIVVVRIFDMDLPRCNSHHRPIVLMQSLDMPAECSAFENLKICLIEPSCSRKARPWKPCQGTQDKSVENKAADIREYE